MATPDLLDALAADHKTVRTMIGDVFANPGRRRVLYPKIALALRYHSHAEEQTLYRALGSYPQEVADVDRSYDEHGALDHALRELDATAYGDPSFLERFARMNELLEAHLVPEESRVFDAARTLISPQQRRDLGAQYERMMHHDDNYPRQSNPCRACEAPRPVGFVENVKQVLANPTEDGRRPRWKSFFGIWSIFGKKM